MIILIYTNRLLLDVEIRTTNLCVNSCLNRSFWDESE